MIGLKWKQASDKSHWLANHGEYYCTITPPHDEQPLPYYRWSVRHGKLDGSGGASQLSMCKASAADYIERQEARSKI